MDKIEQLKSIIESSNNIVFFGGAGVSTESGLKDFRGSNGLYKEKSDFPIEYYLSIDCFIDKPEEFFEFYKKNMNFLDTLPNAFHYYLIELEKKGKLKAIITQNIDGLHQKAGSKNVLEIHGTIYKNHCLKCGQEYSAEYVFASEGVPKCKCGGKIKPDVILYGESLTNAYSEAIEYICSADTLIVAGTSLTVQPASSLVRYYRGSKLVIINKEPTKYDYMADLVINDSLKNVTDKLNT